MIFPFLAHTECALELRNCLQMQSVENLKWAIITVGVPTLSQLPMLESFLSNNI